VSPRGYPANWLVAGAAAAGVVAAADVGGSANLPAADFFRRWTVSLELTACCIT